MKTRLLVAVVAGLLGLGGPIWATGPNIMFQFTETGAGSFMDPNSGTSGTFTGAPGLDPMVGGQTNVLIYAPPQPQFGIPNQGNVILQAVEPGGTTPATSDIIRFIASNEVAFYSDRGDGAESGDLADNAQPNQFPTQLDTPTVTITENPITLLNGTMGFGAIYIPTDGQPGAGKGAKYIFVSDTDQMMGGGGGMVPEPSTFALLGIGTLGLAGYAWRRRPVSVK